MKKYIEARVMDVAHYMMQSNATVRTAAKHFGVSRCTIHKDMVERLPQLNPQIANMITVILENNKAERHIRGGIATRRKYQQERIKH